MRQCRRAISRATSKVGRVMARDSFITLEWLEGFNSDVAEGHLFRVRLQANIAGGITRSRRESAVLVLAGRLGEGRDLLEGCRLAVLHLAEPHRVRVADYFGLNLIPLAR